jgi:hypothetical protein
MWHDQRDLKVTYLKKFNFEVIFVVFRLTMEYYFLIRLKVSEGGTLVTMPVKHFAPKVTVKLCIIDFSSLR